MAIYKGKRGYEVIISYTDSNGQYKQIHRCNKFTRTKSDAKAYEQNLLSNLNKNVVEEKMSFDDLFNIYFTYASNQIKNSTARKINNIYNLHIKPFFSSINIYSLEKKHVLAWQNEINKLDFSAIYKNKMLYILLNIIKFGNETYGAPIVSNIKKFKDANLQKKEMNFFTYDEWIIFRNELDHMTQDVNTHLMQSCKMLFYILYYAGLRIGEALALTYNDIITINGVDFINITKSINMKVTPYEITKPKNNSSIRKVPICDELKKALKEQREYAERNIYGFDNNYYICGYTSPVSPSRITDVKNTICDKANLKRIRIHDFRHSYCSLLINGGIPLLTVSKLLGHSSIDVTQSVYAHMYPEQNVEALNYLNSLKK